jgi:hypothetical protein
MSFAESYKKAQQRKVRQCLFYGVQPSTTWRGLFMPPNAQRSEQRQQGARAFRAEN